MRDDLSRTEISHPAWACYHELMSARTDRYARLAAPVRIERGHAGCTSYGQTPRSSKQDLGEAAQRQQGDDSACGCLAVIGGGAASRPARQWRHDAVAESSGGRCVSFDAGAGGWQMGSRARAGGNLPRRVGGAQRSCGAIWARVRVHGLEVQKSEGSDMESWSVGGAGGVLELEPGASGQSGSRGGPHAATRLAKARCEIARRRMGGSASQQSSALWSMSLVLHRGRHAAPRVSALLCSHLSRNRPSVAASSRLKNPGSGGCSLVRLSIKPLLPHHTASTFVTSSYSARSASVTCIVNRLPISATEAASPSSSPPLSN